MSEPVAEAMAQGRCSDSAPTPRRDHRHRRAGRRHRRQAGWHRVLLRELADGTTDVRTMRLPGNRSDVRERSTTVAMHLLRGALGKTGDQRATL